MVFELTNDTRMRIHVIRATSDKVLVLNKLTMRTRSSLPPQWLQRGWRQTIHRPTYSVARVIGACMARRFHLSQSSVNSHYLCCHVSFIVLVTWTSGHSTPTPTVCLLDCFSIIYDFGLPDSQFLFCAFCFVHFVNLRLTI